MKTKTVFLTIISVFLIFNISTAQRCDKKNFCDKESLETYDYQGQSSFALLGAGDVPRIKIVAYSGQEYKIMVCGDPELGQIQFRVIDEIRKYDKIVKEINEQEVAIYQENEFGAYETDEWGNLIQTGTEMQFDTVWETKRKIEEKLIFDSEKKGESAWYFTCKKTQTFILEIVVPDVNKGYRGCVNVMVGHQSQGIKPKFYTN